MGSLPPDFAASLGQALRELEDRPVSKEDWSREAYIQLCHDDPLISVSHCQALHEALARQEFGLCNRLVDGLDQYLNRRRDADQSSTEESSASLLRQQETGPSSPAEASLGWTVHGRLPWQALSAKSLPEAAAWLGSYRGISINDKQDDDSGHADSTLEQKLKEASNRLDEKETAQIDKIVSGLNSTEEKPNPPTNTEEEEEIWAAESDPSDFAYESDWNPATALQLQDWVVAVDPVALSKVPPDTTWIDVAQAISTLLLQLKPSMLQQPSQSSNDQTLTQLTLALLVPSSSRSPLMQSLPEAHWQKTGLHVLSIYRQFVTQQHATLAPWQDYLALVSMLLQVDEASKLKTSNDPSAAAVAGLAALSALCSHVHYSTAPKVSSDILRLVRKTVFDLSDGLTVMLEGANGDARMYWTFLALLQIQPETAAQAQVVLNSGLFAQWLAVATEQPAWQESVLDLCLAWPALLGKYAWRYPGWAAHVTSDTSSLQSLLWNVLGADLSTLTTVQLRSKKHAPPPSASACKTAAGQAWSQLTEKVVIDLKSSRKEGHDDAALRDFVSLAGRLSQPTTLRRLWLQVFDEKWTAPLPLILQAIADSDTFEPAPVKVKKEDDEDNTADKPTDKPRARRLDAAQVRKAVKTLQSVVESKSTSSKIFSSKAD